MKRHATYLFFSLHIKNQLVSSSSDRTRPQAMCSASPDVSIVLWAAATASLAFSASIRACQSPKMLASHMHIQRERREQIQFYHCHVVAYWSVKHSLSYPLHPSLLTPHLFTPNLSPTNSYLCLQILLHLLRHSPLYLGLDTRLLCFNAGELLSLDRVVEVSYWV
jgi:hypothetical protein